MPPTDEELIQTMLDMMAYMNSYIRRCRRRGITVEITINGGGYVDLTATPLEATPLKE